MILHRIHRLFGATSICPGHIYGGKHGPDRLVVKVTRDPEDPIHPHRVHFTLRREDGSFDPQATQRMVTAERFVEWHDADLGTTDNPEHLKLIESDADLRPWSTAYWLTILVSTIVSILFLLPLPKPVTTHQYVSIVVPTVVLTALVIFGGAALAPHRRARVRSWLPW